ncbi:Dihydrolipoyl dehydrogenase [Balamuthia mandrillaris]
MLRNGFSLAGSSSRASVVLRSGVLGNTRYTLVSSMPGAARAYATAAEEQDLVVIGGGPGGYVAAIKAGQLGMKVTCVEKRGTLGGCCLNVGCIPSKALLNASHIYAETKHYFPEHGIRFDNVKLDLPQMMKSKEQAVAGLTSGIEFLFKKNNVKYVKGTGSITSPNEVSVDLLDGGKTKINTKNILIATGSDVTNLPFLKIDEERVVSSTGALSLKEVPKTMTVIGGGIIGLELGSVWSRLGAEVTVVEFTDAICAGADGEVAREFKKILTKQGLKFKMGTKVTGATTDATGVTLKMEPAKGGETTELKSDVVLVSVGRRPYVDGLGLDKVGVKLDDRGRVDVDDHFRTNVPSIYAIGDCIKGPMLAHKAEEDGIACVEMLANRGGHVDYATVPSVIYTHPEVAWVGQTEEQLKAKGIKYNAGKFAFKANSRARTNGTLLSSPLSLRFLPQTLMARLQMIRTAL